MQKSININTLRNYINDFLITAISAAFPELEKNKINPILQVATRPGFGDYQSNCAMPLAKQLGANPREIALQIIKQINIENSKYNI